MISPVGSHIQAYSASKIYTSQAVEQVKDLPQDSRAGHSKVQSNISTDTVTISQSSRDLLASQSTDAKPSESRYTAIFDTNQGSKELDIDAYFSPATNTKSSELSLLSIPLLMPTQNNVNALVNHLSMTVPKFLAENNIPTAPSSISFDNRGQIQMPADYAYASEFNEALSNNPAMEEELRTVNALSSHMVGIRKSYQFHQEYASATTQAEIEAVVSKYSYLFSGNSPSAAISLNFSENGSLSISADGKLLA